MEAVLRLRIDVDFRLRLLLLDSLNIAERNAGILFAEMHLHRTFRLLVGEFGNHAAVVTDRGLEAVEPAGGKERHAAAEAKADDATRPDRLDVAERGIDVLHRRVPIEIAQVASRMRDLV